MRESRAKNKESSRNQPYCTKITLVVNNLSFIKKEWESGKKNIILDYLQIYSNIRHIYLPRTERNYIITKV